MRDRIYLTVLSTENYLEGVFVLYNSLKKINTKYPFGVFVSKDIKESTIKILEQQGILIIRDREENIICNRILEKNNKNIDFSYWNNTLDKLKIFNLIEFKKIVYLDSDMIVLKNIDELFEKKHMSAVVAGKSYPGNEEWKDINSGLMVIEPKEGLYEKMVALTPKVLEKKEVIGDQDIIQEFYSFLREKEELSLNESYNIFINYVDYYVRVLKYRDIKVIHYTGAKKPWMLTKFQKVKKALNLMKKGKKEELKYFFIYYKNLKEALKCIK